MKNLLTLAKQGKTALGMYVGDAGETVAEIACYAGFDYLRIDCEHSLNDFTKIQNLIRIANTSDVPTLVRISTLSDITRILDFGASGILVPDISTAAQAREAVRLTKFAPIGERGMTNMGRCVRYSDIPLTEYCKRANDEVALAVQIESREGVKNIDEILSVEGIDIVTTGRQDFSQSYGVPGQSSHPSVEEAENTVIAKGVEHRVFPLITAGSPAAMEALKARGVLLQTICFDGAFLMKQFKDLIASFRA
jgi:4-hydroxy-2-oxoheptanedioate aldolase